MDAPKRVIAVSLMRPLAENIGILGVPPRLRGATGGGSALAEGTEKEDDDGKTSHHMGLPIIHAHGP